MELKDFVRVTLTQIAQGAIEAREEVLEAGGIVNPAVQTKVGDRHFASLDNGCPVFLVAFDVALTVKDAGEVTGGAKGGLLQVLTARVDGKSSTASESVSRIQFHVPLALAVDPTTAEEFSEKVKRQAASLRAHRVGKIG